MFDVIIDDRRARTIRGVAALSEVLGKPFATSLRALNCGGRLLSTEDEKLARRLASRLTKAGLAVRYCTEVDAEIEGEPFDWDTVSWEDSPYLRLVGEPCSESFVAWWD